MFFFTFTSENKVEINRQPLPQGIILSATIHFFLAISKKEGHILNFQREQFMFSLLAIGNY